MTRTPEQHAALHRVGKVVQRANTLDDRHTVCDRLHTRWESAGLHHNDAHGLAGICLIKARRIHKDATNELQRRVETA